MARRSDPDKKAPRPHGGLDLGDRRLRESGLSDQVGFRLRAAQAAVWADFTAALQPHGLRPHHYAALLIIAGSPGCKQLEVGAALSIFSSNLVVLIDELCGLGLVVRDANPGDRRSHALSLTEAGVALMPVLDRAHAEHSARIAQAVTPCDPALFESALERLAMMGRKGPGCAG